MEFEFWMIYIPVMTLLLAFAGYIAISYKPSQKYGNTLREKRHATFDKVRNTGVGKLPSNLAYKIKQKVKDIGKEKTKPVIKIDSPKKESKVTINRTPEPNENPWNTATFYYEDEKTTQYPCGNWRIGDIYTDPITNKTKHIKFTVEPGIYKGKMILYLTNPHVDDDLPEEVTGYQISTEPQYFARMN